MSICYIVGAGDCPQIDFVPQKNDIVIAADGGLKHLERVGLKPDVIIGDFDSLGVIPQGENIVKLKPEKDITDMDAAVGAGIEAGFSEFMIYGATGGRIDHTLANIQLTASLAQRGMKASIHDGKTVITAITNGSLEFGSDFKGYVSVFAHSDECSGIYLEGLKYPLHNAVLKNTFPLGVSNEFIGVKSKITVENGTVIVVYTCALS